MAACAVLLCLALVESAAAQAPTSELVYYGSHGQLVYKPDPLGNRIPDFSHAGYGGGAAAIPDLPVRVTLNPSAGGDDTARIQSAINQVSQLPMDANGFRGAVLLTAGEYRIATSLRIHTSGVVLRGEGRWGGETHTTLRGTGTTQRTLVNIGGSGSTRPSMVSGTRRDITDKYVPVGAQNFRVTDSSIYNVGDRILIHRPSTEEWITDIGMNQIPPRPDGGTIVQWQPGAYDRFMDRVITRIEGNQITVDAPLTNALEEWYGGGSIYKYTMPHRISNVGVENMMGISDYAHPTDEDHAWQFINFANVENGWAREITGKHFGFGTVSVGRGTKWITVEDVANIDPISQIAGSRRYAFYLSGELTLVQRAYSRNGRHDFAMNSHAPGLNVFLYAVAQNVISDSGPHHRWSMGGLFDNVKIEGGDLNIRNRLNAGTGHGWAGANYVVWNSLARRMIIESPPTATNWAIGAVAGQRSGDAVWESFGRNVDPYSLYLAQLRDRMNNPHIKRREYLMGDYDLFEYDGAGSADDVHVDPAWLAAVQSADGRPVVGFDTFAGDQQVPFTVTYDLTGDTPVWGMLILSMQATGPGHNGRIYLEDLTGGVSFAELGWELSESEPFIAMLDLGQEVSMLADGQLNVLITGNVAVDWAVLQMHVMPEPGIAGLLALAATIFMRRRCRR